MEEGERAAVCLEEGLGQDPRSCDTIFALKLLRVAGAGEEGGGGDHLVKPRPSLSALTG